MVLIISSNRDQTTLNILEYLKQWTVEYIFIHEQNKVTDITIDHSFITLILNNNQKVDLRKITAFWYRRADVFFDKEQLKQPISHPAIADYLENEWSILKDYFYTLLSTKKGLGNFSLSQAPNKITNLLLAKKHAIKTPKTIITSSKKALVNFYNNHQSTGIITKNVGESFGARIENTLIYQLGTTKIKKEQLDLLSNKFHPILAQECLQKEYEIRVFFVKDQFYAMAIFSQQNIKTQVDFRHYDEEKPNRKVPYILPIELEKKLFKCMTEIGLDTGSIDIVVTKNGYYFLEVNPIGQFGWLSSTCNYYIEEKIAQYLAYEKNN